MASRRSAPASYRAAQLQARRLENALLRDVVAQVQRAVRKTAERIANLLARLPDSTPAARVAALQQSVAVARRLEAQLRAELERAIASGRAASFDRILGAWQDASARAAAAVGIPNAALGAVLVPRATMLAAFERVGGARLFRTLTEAAARDGFARVNDVIRRAIAEGQSFDKLAKDMRAFVRGAEGGDVASAFRTARYNATRIGYSEIHNARQEAEVGHFSADPLVRAVGWRLAPDRGTLRQPDICDALASNDFYGLGAGVYPVDAVPPTPHPFDRCELVPIVRPVSQMNRPKPRPPLSVPAELQGVGGIGAAGRARLARDLSQLLR
jgi:hypothetical protein